MKRMVFAVAVAVVAAAPALAQDGLETRCATIGQAQAREACSTVAQAVESAQPQLGILLAGGNPTLGTASTGGVRLGVLPRVSGGIRINAVQVKVPNILEEDSGVEDEQSFLVPALGANVSIGLSPGMSLAPTIGGFGAIDLLGSATWIPTNLVDVDGIEDGTENISWGAGVRVGIIRESFLTPGISVSAMYRRLGTFRYGDVCPSGPVDAGGIVTCTGSGDEGEFAFDLTNWSGRAAVSKRLLGLGLTAGVGYDRFTSEGELAFRGEPIGVISGTRRIYRFEDLELESDRWSAFLDGSFTLLLATLTAEIGWMQGSDPIEGFPSTSDFDPKEGTFFGSLGLRLSL
jgi:hypothetical protein